jgi:glutamyl-Q tRNA(Asp) synthetase
MYVTRFAPSPTGPLHLGHVYSAAIGYRRAQALGGSFLLRIEDIDRVRSRKDWEDRIYDDLSWIGLRWNSPVLRQSERLGHYQAALDHMTDLGLLYPCKCARADIRAALSAPQEDVPIHGPDGLIYPGTCRHRSMSDATPQDALRLNIGAAFEYLARFKPLQNISFTETGPIYEGHHIYDSAHFQNTIGDVVLARRDMGTSYHLSVVVDDAAQGITEVVRGADLWEATPLHRFLQSLLNLPEPKWHHHALIRNETGKRLAKRDDARAISTYREAGESPADVLRRVGLDRPC